MDAAKSLHDTALVELTTAKSSVVPFKEATKRANIAESTALTNLQIAKNAVLTATNDLTAAQSKATKDTASLVVVPAYKTLTTPNTAISIGSTKTAIPMIKPDQNFNLTGAAITYTFSFDIKLTQYSSSWFNVFQNGSDNSDPNQRYPSLWLTGNNFGNAGLIHYIHDTKFPSNFNIIGNTKLPLDTFNTITIVVSNNIFTVYINGEFEASKTANVSNGLAWGPNDTIVNNWNWVGSGWTSTMSGVVVKNANWWTTGLSADVVKRYYYDISGQTDPLTSNNRNSVNQLTSTKTDAELALTKGNFQALYNSAVTARERAVTAETNANTNVLTKYDTYIQKARIYSSETALYNSANTLVTQLAGVASTKSVSLNTLLSITSQLFTLTQTYTNSSTIPTIDLNIDPLNPLKASVNNSITKYRNNQTEINTLAPVLNKNKETLKDTQSQLKSRKEQGSKLNTYKYIELSIMLIITIFAFVIISVPFEDSMKTILTSILSLIAVANILIIYYVFDKPGLIETFDVSEPDLLTQNNTNITVALHQFMDASIQYLLQTDNLNILLQSKMVYGNVNQGLSKELTYYNDASNELINSNITVDSVYKSSYMTQIHYSAAMQLFMSLSLIVAGFTISFVTLESLEITGSVYSWVSGITAFFIIIVLIIYMLEVSIRVHTNPKKVYWGNPKNLSD